MTEAAPPLRTTPRLGSMSPSGRVPGSEAGASPRSPSPRPPRRRGGTRPRLRRPVLAADRAPHPRVRRLQRAASPRHAARADQGAGAEGPRALRRAGIGLRRRGAGAPRRSCSSSGIPVLGICYGMQSDGPRARRPVEQAPAGEFGRSQLTLRDGGGTLLDGPAGRAAVLDEPPRHRLRAAARLHRARLEHGVAGRRGRGHRARALRDPVPPRGRPHAVRHRDPHPLPPRRRRLPREVVAGLGDRGAGPSDPRAGRRGPRDLRPLRRRRLGRPPRCSSTARSATASPASSSTTG